MLFVAAVGVSVALSQYVLAVGATVFVLAVLRGMKFIDARTVRRRRRQVEERLPSD